MGRPGDRSVWGPAWGLYIGAPRPHEEDSDFSLPGDLWKNADERAISFALTIIIADYEEPGRSVADDGFMYDGRISLVEFIGDMDDTRAHMGLVQRNIGRKECLLPPR